MGRSSISFGSFKYLLSLMQTSPFPLWKASASLTQDISFNHARHLHAQVPLPSAKVQHFKDHLRTYSELTEIIGLNPRKSHNGDSLCVPSVRERQSQATRCEINKKTA